MRLHIIKNNDQLPHPIANFTHLKPLATYSHQHLLASLYTATSREFAKRVIFAKRHCILGKSQTKPRPPAYKPINLTLQPPHSPYKQPIIIPFAN